MECADKEPLPKELPPSPKKSDASKGKMENMTERKTKGRKMRKKGKRKGRSRKEDKLKTT